MVEIGSSVLNILLKTVGLCVAGIDALRERREVLMANFFKRQQQSSSLRNAKPFYSIRARANGFRKSLFRTVSITIHSSQ